MNFNIGYVSVGRLFPTQYQATVFGTVNFVAHCLTIAAPMVAELPRPIPFYGFVTMSCCSILAASQLKELQKDKPKIEDTKQVENEESVDK